MASGSVAMTAAKTPPEGQVRVNHSGGVRGADLCWQKTGSQYQVKTRAYRPFDDPAPENPCSVVLDQQMLLEADPLLRQAGAVMGVDFAGLPTKEQNYVRKNYFQVAAAEAVFAVAKVVRKSLGAVGAPADTLAGGTAWAFHMAILQRKPIYIFDNEEGSADCTQRWYWYNYQTGHLEPYEGVPVLPNHFAGIGTRELSAAGAGAIAQVFQATFCSPPAATIC